MSYLDNHYLALYSKLSPEELYQVIESGLPVWNLTYAAEALACVPNDSRKTETLLRLLAHSDPVVREGAVYGTGKSSTDPAVVTTLNKMLDSDPSAEVRICVSDVLAAFFEQ
jgi:HEAT repeat protein